MKKPTKNRRSVGKFYSLEGRDDIAIEESQPFDVTSITFHFYHQYLNFMSFSFLILCLYREKGPRLDPKDYTIGDLTGELAAKMPGEINGQQFIIQNNKVRLITEFTCQELKLNQNDELARWVSNKITLVESSALYSLPVRGLRSLEQKMKLILVDQRSSVFVHFFIKIVLRSINMIKFEEKKNQTIWKDFKLVKICNKILSWMYMQYTASVCLH